MPLPFVPLQIFLAGAIEQEFERSKKESRKPAAEIGNSNFFQRLGDVRQALQGLEILQEPDVILTETPRVPGTDGRRMAKSYGNAIWLSDTPGRNSQESAQHDDRPAARPPHGSGPAGSLSCVCVSQFISGEQIRRGLRAHRARGPRVPHRRNWLRRLQKADGGRAHQMDCADSGATQRSTKRIRSEVWNVLEDGSTPRQKSRRADHGPRSQGGV